MRALGNTVFQANGLAQVLRKRRQQRSLGCARDDDTRKCFLPIPFLFRCVSQPPPLRGTSFHGKEGEPCHRIKAFPAWEGSDARIPFPPYRHFERKREIFFAHGHERNGRASENGKRRTPYAPGSRRFMRALKKT